MVKKKSATKIANFGPVSAGWLAEIGVFALDELREMGAVEAYNRVKALHPDRVSLNFLYGAFAALEGIPWNQIPDEVKADLRKQSELRASDAER